MALLGRKSRAVAPVGPTSEQAWDDARTAGYTDARSGLPYNPPRGGTMPAYARGWSEGVMDGRIARAADSIGRGTYA